MKFHFCAKIDCRVQWKDDDEIVLIVEHLMNIPHTHTKHISEAITHINSAAYQLFHQNKHGGIHIQYVAVLSAVCKKPMIFHRMKKR